MIDQRHDRALEAWSQHNAELVIGEDPALVERYRGHTNVLSQPQDKVNPELRQRTLQSIRGPLAQLPAQDLFTEQAVLGCLLFEPEAADFVLARCRWEHFYRQAHQIIFLAAKEVARLGRPVDLVTVAAKMAEVGGLDECGGHEYLICLIGSVPTTAHVNAYILILNECLIERTETQYALLRAEGEAKLAAEKAILLEELRAFDTDSGLRPLGSYDLGAGMEKHLQQVNFEHGEGCPPHVDIPAFDELMGGLPAPGFVVVKGGTKEGKTSLALQALTHWAFPKSRMLGGQESSTDCHGRSAVYVTLEMDTETQAGPRMARMLCGPTATAEALHDAAACAMTADIEVMDKPGATIEEISAELRRLKRRRPEFPALTVVDYLQLVQSSVAMDERLRLQFVAEKLKALAKELGTCMVVPSQVTYSEDGQEQRSFGARFIDFTADRIVTIKKPGKTSHDRQTAPEGKLLLTSRDGPGGEADVAWTGVRFRDAKGTTWARPYKVPDGDPEQTW